jgi:hypothetical protein
MDRPKCETCKWWYIKGFRAGFGSCRRYPPNVANMVEMNPTTMWKFWCGEHTPADSAKNESEVE